MTYAYLKNHLGFAGGVYDVDTKLTHFGFRDYDAFAGVWTAKDPVRLRGGLNLFSYALNSPTRNVDPTGKFVEFLEMDRFAILDVQLTLLDVLLQGKRSRDGLKRLYRDRKNGIKITRKPDDWDTNEGGLTSAVNVEKDTGRRYCTVSYSIGGHLLSLSRQGIDTSKYGHTTASLVGHEVGHAYSKLYENDSSQEAIDWERELLPDRAWNRPNHHTPYPK